MAENTIYKFAREDARCYTRHDPASNVWDTVDMNDPNAVPVAEYGLPEGFSDKAKDVWAYLEGAAYIFEYKGRLVVTDESLYLTEAGDGSEGNPIGFPRYTADSWEEVEAWLEEVADQMEEEDDEE